MAGHRTLIKGGRIATMDDALGEFEGDLLIEGSIIRAVAAAIDEPADEIIDARDMIVIPGLVDTHTHVWETPFRGLQEEYFIGVYPRRVLFTPEDVYAGVYAGALEFIANGTTTVVDFCHVINSLPHAIQAVAALRDAGIRGVHCHSFSRSPRAPAASHEQLFEEAEWVREDIVQNDNGGLLSMMIGVSERQHGVEIPTFAREFDFARQHGLRIQCHMIREKHLTAFHRAGFLGPDFMPVHGTSFSKAELDLMRDHQMALSFNPYCEYRRDLCAMLGQALERGIPVAWGVDVPCSFEPDLFKQMQLVVQMQAHYDAVEDKVSGRTTRRKPTLGAYDAFKAGTQVGAKTIGLGDKTGSLTPGKEADVVLMRLPYAGLCGSDVATHLMYQSGARDVDTVFIAGKLRKRGGQMVDVDQARVRHLVREARDNVMARPFEPGIEWKLPGATWAHIEEL